MSLSPAQTSTSREHLLTTAAYYYWSALCARNCLRLNSGKFKIFSNLMTEKVVCFNCFLTKMACIAVKLFGTNTNGSIGRSSRCYQPKRPKQVILTSLMLVPVLLARGRHAYPGRGCTRRSTAPPRSRALRAGRSAAGRRLRAPPCRGCGPSSAAPTTRRAQPRSCTAAGSNNRAGITAPSPYSFNCIPLFEQPRFSYQDWWNRNPPGLANWGLVIKTFHYSDLIGHDNY